MDTAVDYDNFVNENAEKIENLFYFADKVYAENESIWSRLFCQSEADLINTSEEGAAV